MSAVEEAVRLRPETTLYRDFRELLERRGTAAMLRLASRLTTAVFLWR
ncbi:hypothetical protein [Streptomyces pratensis]|nr:hypothetical protein [Streptomyces pratensis]